jgi:hypothetical protein
MTKRLSCGNFSGWPRVNKPISGHSPFTPEQHMMSRFRYNACGVYTTASLPETVLTDDDTGQKYGYSARTLMAIYT